MSNPQYVFIFALGPVQGFIAAARRTRDLWFGSQLLSDLAGAAATHLRDKHGADLVFPATLPAAGGAVAGVSNKIVCVLRTDAPAAAAADAKQAVLDFLPQQGAKCKQQIVNGGLQTSCDWLRFDQQLATAMECYAAWARIDNSAGGGLASGPHISNATPYMQAYRAANHALEARKRTRNFEPNPCAAAGAALSSLDGEHESVLTGDRATEELDALGLMKRVLGTEASGPSIVRVALEPFIHEWPAGALAAMESEMATARASGLVRRIKCNPGELWHRMPFDAELLLKSRRDLAARQANADGDAGALACLAAIEKLLWHKTYEGLPVLPLPDGDALYFALLVADGDKMGVLLSENDATSQVDHAAVSTALAAFAGAAPAVVAQHAGACIYAGGDDVIALLPVATAVACARDLADGFSKRVGSGGQGATLSVGLAFCHVLTPFSLVRERGHQALQLAKNGPTGQGLRNALALAVHPRNGAAVSVCGRWDDANAALPVQGFDRAMHSWCTAFAGQGLSSSTPYDLQRLADSVPQVALVPEVQRLLGRRGLQGSSAAVQNILARLRLPAEDGSVPPATLLAQQLYVARWLAQQPQPAKKGSTGQNTASEPDASSNVVPAVATPS
jgi:CRISPR-associated protein Cmr2